MEASTWNEQSWNAALDKLMDRASEDMAFRRLCLTDPRAALEQVSGMAVPEQVSIRFSNEEMAMVYRLPPPASDRELSAEELESVAGGSLCISTSSWCVSSNCSSFCIANTGYCF